MENYEESKEKSTQDTGQRPQHKLCPYHWFVVSRYSVSLTLVCRPYALPVLAGMVSIKVWLWHTAWWFFVLMTVCLAQITRGGCCLVSGRSR